MSKELVRVFLPTVAILLVWVLLLEPAGSAPCVTPPAVAGTNAFTLAEGWAPQPTWPTDWYYITGYLCVIDSTTTAEPDLLLCRDPIGFQLTTFLVNRTVGTTTVLASEVDMAISYRTHYETQVVGLPILSTSAFSTYNLPKPFLSSSSFDLGFYSPTVSMSYTSLSGAPGTVGSAYQFSATSPNATIYLNAISQAPSMFHGEGGYFAGPAPAPCAGDYYVSMPQLDTTGIIILNGQTFSVRGLSWMDSEWLSGALTSSASTSGSTGGGWTWNWFKFGTSSVMLEIAHTGTGHTYNGSHAEVQHADGTMEKGMITSIEVLRTWTSPSTGIVYAVDVIFTTTVDSIQKVHVHVDPTKPWLLNQEVSAASYWEGMVIGSVTSIDRRRDRYSITSGFGYLEMVGYKGFDFPVVTTTTTPPRFD